MPNWCENEVTIELNEADFQDFLNNIAINYQWDGKEKIAQIEEKAAFMSFFVPLSGTKGLPIDEEREFWEYPNALKMWGVKWDLEIKTITVNKGGEHYQLSMNFDTAWEPPVAFYRTLCEMYPKMRMQNFSYEPGAAFWHIVRYNEKDSFHEKRGSIIAYDISGIEKEHFLELCLKTHQWVTIVGTPADYFAPTPEETKQMAQRAFAIIEENSWKYTTIKSAEELWAIGREYIPTDEE